MASEPNNNSQMTPNGNSDTNISTLTLRMIMQGKEAGSIIGKKGDNVKKFREESGAKINISDSSCPERIVTVTGTTDQIFKAFSMICKKFEDVRTSLIQQTPASSSDILTNHQNSSLPKPPVTVRLIIPASQCGSLIGKGGAKIKEIREVTGASIQVASEMLPNSTERAVTISGTADAITQCIYHICCVMIESPPKGATIPYRPKPAVPPVIFAGGQAFTLQGQSDPRGGPNMVQFNPATQHHHIPQLSKVPVQQGMGLPMHGTMLMHPGSPAGIIPATSLAQGFHPAQAFPRPQMAAMHQQMQQQGAPGQQTHEMTIPNDLIGCIIGRGGAKINEIRQLSGASIKIANSDEGCTERKVSIMGSPETINAAQYLINASLEMHKQLNPELAAAAAMNAMGGGGHMQHQVQVSLASHHPQQVQQLSSVHTGAHASLKFPPQLMSSAAAAAAAGSPIFDSLAGIQQVQQAKPLTTKLKTGASPQQLYHVPCTMASVVGKKQNGTSATAAGGAGKFAPY